MLNISIVLVYNREADKILLCRRECEKETGERDLEKFDLICDRRRFLESGIDCAHRKLKVETGIAENDITLQRVIDFIYVLEQKRLQVFAGTASRADYLRLEGNTYYWAGVDDELSCPNSFVSEECLRYILNDLRYDQNTGLFEGATVVF